MQKLTPKQEQFARCIAIDGMSYADAYRNSYSTKNMKDGAVYVEASRMMENPKIALRIKEIAKEVEAPRIMNSVKRKERLTEFANSEDPMVAMKAIDLLNKMEGEYVQKVEAEVKAETTINIELVDDGE